MAYSLISLRPILGLVKGDKSMKHHEVVIDLSRRDLPEAFRRLIWAAVTRQEHQCPNFQFQAIASAASSSSATISSWSNAIGAHARF